MNNAKRRAVRGVIGLCVTALGLAAFAVAAPGPLDPPGGAVGPTGRTLEEIYQRIGSINIGGNGIGVPGAAQPNSNTFTCNFNGQFTFPVLAYSIRNEVVVNSGGGGGGTTPVRGVLTLTLDLHKSIARLDRALKFATSSATGTLTVPMKGDTMVMNFSTLQVLAVRHYSLPRGDGMTAQLVDVDIGWLSSSSSIGVETWQFP